MPPLKTKGMSRSDIVRQYLGRHPTASVSQTVADLKDYHISEALAAKIKYKESRTGMGLAPKPAVRAASSDGAASSKAAQIRAVAASMGPPVRPTDVRATLATRGITVSFAEVGRVLRSMGLRRKRRRGRKPASGTPAAARSVATAGVNIDDLVAAKKLVGQIGSIEKVREALAALARLS